jgi:nucleoid-associated protein YgaU
MAATTNDPLQALLASGAVETGPFAANSRYRGVALAQMKRADGTVLVYLRRRFVPRPSAFATLGSYQVQQGDRCDSIAARLLGDPQLWWRLADANRTIDPRELTATIGQWLRVGAPRDAGGSGSGG